MSDVLVWTDVETTGLDPELHSILELGMKATDWNLEPIAGVNDLHVVARPDVMAMRRMEAIPLQMHTDNGLIDESNKSIVRELDLTTYIIEWTSWLNTKTDGRIILAGSSVHFDRRFIDNLPHPYSRPALVEVSHRQLDVSVLDMLAEHLYPDVYAHRPERTTNHRVMACLHDSMALYRYYRERLVCGSVGVGVSDCSGVGSGAQDGPVVGDMDVSASAWDEGYQIGLGDGLHGTRNVNPYRGKES